MGGFRSGMGVSGRGIGSRDQIQPIRGQGWRRIPRWRPSFAYLTCSTFTIVLTLTLTRSSTFVTSSNLGEYPKSHEILGEILAPHGTTWLQAVPHVPHGTSYLVPHGTTHLGTTWEILPILAPHIWAPHLIGTSYLVP